ncbi:MAG TPA: RluA family pseudouridine synthase [Candidatus Ozemobacteraceae bacterium]|nr:RluA family pseudouridine synthase [Candidatus Ozemobacteraceae bacterium]
MSELQITWTAEAALKGERLDVALVARFAERSRAFLQNLIKEGRVTVNASAVKPGYKLKAGDLVAVNFPDDTPQPSAVAATAMTLPILYEDDDLIAVNKPVGLVVHPGAGREADTVVSQILGYTRLSPIGEPHRPGVVHRLDKGTSGVLVLAKTEWMHHRLVKAFAGRAMTKEYLAIVRGVPEPKSGRIEVSIERDRVNRKRMTATDPDRGKPAISIYEVTEIFRGAALVRVRILTGRTHQIRVHLSCIGHPLLGDSTYGGGKHEFGAGHFLHSQRLSFEHPRTKQPINLEAPLPSPFESALAVLRSRPSEAQKTRKTKKRPV